MVFNEEIIIEKLMIAYLDARKNERSNLSQLEFEIDLEENLYKLKLEILKRTYKPSPLICFIIDYPVKREVFAPNFRDRVISHFIYNEISPLFERTFIYDSYSCRKNKGTLFGIERAEHHISSITNNRTEDAYALSLDISGYFMNINRQILLDIIKDTFEKYKCRKYDKTRTWEDITDFDLITKLLETILLRNPLKNCQIIGGKYKWKGLPPNKSLFNSPDGVGLIIGDLISQLLSNVYMNIFDQFVKRELKCKHYGRYVDDAYILHKDKEYLKSIIPQIQEFLEKRLGLKLNKKKIKICNLSQNFCFLGACIKPYRRYVKNRTIKNFRKKVYNIEKTINNDNYTEYAAVLNSYLGYLTHFKAYKEKQNTLNRYNNIKKYYRLTKTYNKIIKQFK